MTLVWTESKAVDTIGVFGILSESKLILELKELDAASRFTCQDQSTILTELQAGHRVIELEYLLRWRDCVWFLSIFCLWLVQIVYIDSGRDCCR